MAKHPHTHPHRSRLEKIGFSLSLLCTIHCLTMPFIIALLPMAGSLFSNPLVEVSILGSSILIAWFNLVRDFRRYHGRFYPLALLVAGAAFIVIELCNSGETHSHLPAVLGGLFIFAAYLLNWYFSRHYQSCEVK